MHPPACARSGFATAQALAGQMQGKREDEQPVLTPARQLEVQRIGKPRGVQRLGSAGKILRGVADRIRADEHADMLVGPAPWDYIRHPQRPSSFPAGSGVDAGSSIRLAGRQREDTADRRPPFAAECRPIGYTSFPAAVFCQNSVRGRDSPPAVQTTPSTPGVEIVPRTARISAREIAPPCRSPQYRRPSPEQAAARPRWTGSALTVAGTACSTKAGSAVMVSAGFQAVAAW